MYYKEKKYNSAYQSFISANKSFGTMTASKRQNIGIALCTSAEGYLLFNKSLNFVTNKMDEN